MRRVVLIVVLGLLAVACGGGGEPGEETSNGGGDRDFDRCSLVSGEEAEQWLGTPVDYVGPADLPVGAEDTCSYESSANQMRILLQVSDGEQYFAFEGSGARGPVTLEGLGEDAHTDGTYVAFLQDGFSVRVSQIQGNIPQQDLEEMAQLVESRLP